MTVQADLIRNKRRAFATPGGFHDRLIGLLVKALPAAIGLIAAVMVLTPLFQRGEISFLLDRNKVAVTDKRLAVSQAMYRGEDNRAVLAELLDLDDGSLDELEASGVLVSRLPRV